MGKNAPALSLAQDAKRCYLVCQATPKCNANVCHLISSQECYDYIAGVPLTMAAAAAFTSTTRSPSGKHQEMAETELMSDVRLALILDTVSQARKKILFIPRNLDSISFRAVPFQNGLPSVWVSSRRRCPPRRGQPGSRFAGGASTRRRHLHPCTPGGGGSGCLRPPRSRSQTPLPPTWQRTEQK